MLQRAVSADHVADPAGAAALETLRGAFKPGAMRFRPEDNPFRVLFADITHRCNMACRNCYIPVRDLPDLPVDWLYAILGRLPRRTRIRLVGAEPTMRADLPEIIRRVRTLGHTPVILSNGLKLGRASYVRTLREAGLGTVYLSLNGGLEDSLYEAIDGTACAKRKLKALDNLLAAHMNVTSGTIVIQGLNDGHLADFLPWLLARGVRDLHFRSVGRLGRHMADCSLSLDGLEACIRGALGDRAGEMALHGAEGSSRDYRLGTAMIQLTEWPDLGSLDRGRIAPDGYVEPMFESMVENAFHY